MAKDSFCRWKCGRRTSRRCGICLECCDARDQLNKRIDEGLAAYIPPSKRPGHRLYEGAGKKPRTDKQIAAMAKARAARKVVSTEGNGHGGGGHGLKEITIEAVK